MILVKDLRKENEIKILRKQVQELLVQQEKSILKEANSKSLREKQMTLALLNINNEDTIGSIRGYSV